MVHAWSCELGMPASAWPPMARHREASPRRRYRRSPWWLLVLSMAAPVPAFAASSSPRLAAYYDDYMALCDGAVYTWQAGESPRASVARHVVQLGIGKRIRYALARDGTLMAWERDGSAPTELMREVASFHAGRSGLLIVREDASLWRIDTDRLWGFGEKIATEARRLATDVRTASVGDSANYYVDRQGRLFVKGRAHRGQYGDGRLTATDTYVQTFDRVVQVVSHTGHTLVLREDGSVWGTGGNIYGPLGRHGYGDKADRWGRIFDDARAIATGSSHSLAIRNDASLWIWGRDESLEPRQVLSGVAAVAAGNRGSIALARGYLWYWETGAEPDRIMPCGE